MKQDELQNRLDRVIGWINNCDQKASILLAFIGVAFPSLISSDFTIKVYQEIISDLIHYWKEGEGNFSCIRCICSLCTILSILLFGASIYCILNTLSGRVSSSDFKEPGLTTESLVFFGSISSMEYKVCKKSLRNQSEEEIINDLMSQLYVNSKICAIKFESYNKALRYLRWGIPALLVTFILLLLI